MNNIDPATDRKEFESVCIDMQFQTAALCKFLEVFSWGDTLYDLGKHLTCIEAEALGNLLLAHGFKASHDQLMRGHVIYDESCDMKEHLEMKAMYEKENEQ